MSDQQMQLHLDFDPKTLDYIANVLGQRPYAEVHQVLQNIAVQVQGQQRAAAAMAGLAQSNGSGEGQALPQ
jgi:hypothetical protein